MQRREAEAVSAARQQLLPLPGARGAVQLLYARLEMEGKGELEGETVG